MIVLLYKTRNIAIAVTLLNTQAAQTIAQSLAQVRHTPRNVSYETMEGNFERNLARSHELS